MSHAYRAVQWNRHKRVYDAFAVACVVAYVGAFLALGTLLAPEGRAPGPEVLLIRALGTAGIILLHIVLCIGPLARLDARFAPLLYNRRHLGVLTFLVGLGHALLATLYYGAFGGRNPASAVLAESGSWASISGFPFEVLGLGALAILFVMAATSHDFWLANLTPRVWKWLHMSVYGAYALLLGHVALGALQSEPAPVHPILLGAGLVLVGALHFLAGRRELRREAAALAPQAPWVDVGPFNDIPEGRAKVVCLQGRERVALFRQEGRVHAVTNVCAHQGGPLGEGRIVGGCITCPWHGYQYHAKNGQSPPPFTERIATYEVRVRGGRVELNPTALPPGTEPPQHPPSPAPEAAHA